jgi:2-polyprenyl-3-methyl-5-hydroxy-6-metoxy-1,4-benzoquinol methylase
MFLHERHRLPEIMDQPGLDVARHRKALRGLARINAFSGSARLLWPPIAALAQTTSRPLRVVDFATGGGDVPLRLWRRALRAGLSLRTEACDLSPVAIEHARSAAAGTDVRFFVHDVLASPPPGDFDVAISSLFLHHLDEDQAITLMRHMSSAAPIVIINDLERRFFGWLLAWLGTRLLSTSRVVHIDGPRSVAGAFTIAEARSLAERAGLTEVQVTRHCPFRFRLIGRRR